LAVNNASARPDESVQVAPGFKLRTNGLLDIDDIYTEISFYDGNWTIAQQHDRFQPGPATQPSSPNVYDLSGTLATTPGDLKIDEHVTKADDGSIKYVATVSSAKEIQTNELSLAFLLPTKSFGGKQIVIDQQPIALPAEPAQKGAAVLQAMDDVEQVELPLAKGDKLAISGHFKLLIQDDREWGDARYSMLLYFTPGSGDIKESKIELLMKRVPAVPAAPGAPTK
jgi:hypothetical protein